MAWLETISEMARPAPKRLACSRTNQLPMPASGARTTRLGMVRPPSCQDSSSEGMRVILGVAVERPDQPQAGEGEQVVRLVDALGEGHDGGGQPAGGDHVGGPSQLG